MNTAEIIALEDRYGAHNYHPLDVILTRAKGIYVEDIEGNRYMDFLAAYSAVNQGHNHPRIVQALIDQAQKLALTSRAFRNDQLPFLQKELCDLTGYQKMLPMNSGAEAVETAIKTARKWGYMIKGIEEAKAEIIVCEGNFHGRTTTIISFSTEPQYKKDFGPLTPGFVIVPYGDSESMKKAITKNTAAIMIEPIQGEGGVLIPPAGYLREVRALCTENNTLMIADEIQSGFGRTGALFACDHENVKPDLLVVGKALSGGLYPVSAVLGSDETLGLFKPGDHGSTFGGNPLACAVSRAAITVLLAEKLVERSKMLGEYLLDRLREINSPYVETVRGKGLWVGIVLKQTAGGARRFCVALKNRGILAKETHANIIRLAPPLVITREELDWACARIGEVLTA